MMLLKNIFEAAKNDLTKAAEAKAIVKYVSSQIKNYSENNNVIKKTTSGYSIKYKDLTINITSKFSASTLAVYIPSTNTIFVYNADFESDPSFSEFHLFHELIHYLDSKVVKDDIKSITKKYVNKIDQSGKQGEEEQRKAYLNLPLEFNAHFFEYFLPSILHDIQNDKIDPELSFNDFLQNVKSTEEFNSFYSYLEPKFQQKLLKRIAGIYQELKNPQNAKQLTTINVDNLENEKKKYSWLNKLWDKLGNY